MQFSKSFIHIALLFSDPVSTWFHICLSVCCTVDKMAVVLSFADACSSFSFCHFFGVYLSSG